MSSLLDHVPDVSDSDGNRRERVAGVEPAPSGWGPGMQPLHHTRTLRDVVEPEGFEPPSPTREVGVLPLDDDPRDGAGTPGVEPGPPDLQPGARTRYARSPSKQRPPVESNHALRVRSPAVFQQPRRMCCCEGGNRTHLGPVNSRVPDRQASSQSPSRRGVNHIARGFLDAHLGRWGAVGVHHTTRFSESAGVHSRQSAGSPRRS